MTLTRNQFFVLLFALIIGPFIAHKAIWIFFSERTAGRVLFKGRTIEVQGTSDHYVVKYGVGYDSLFFNTADALAMQKGSIVPVLYQKNDPADACVNSLTGIWLTTIIYALFPFLVLVVLYCTPERFEPLIPRNAKIKIGREPFLKILPPIQPGDRSSAGTDEQ
jgi:hypothetical protein